MKNRLQEILEDQLVEAKAKAGQKVVRKLGRGLRIELMCFKSDVHLAITRDDKFPSLKEWETVMKSFPCQVPKVEPTSDQSGSRYCISARFALERTVQMKFL